MKFGYFGEIMFWVGRLLPRQGLPGIFLLTVRANVLTVFLIS